MPRTLVNLGIGLPSLVASFVHSEAGVFFQSENGVIGLGARPPVGMEDSNLTDAGGSFVTAVLGAAAIDSAMAFGLIRGGHIDVTVLGSLQVDETGHLANWMIPGKMEPGMGGAMDLATRAWRAIVAMQRVAKDVSKVVRKCDLPLTSSRPIDLLVTDMAVFEVRNSRLTLTEIAPGLTLETVANATEACFATADDLRTIA